jgi:hypothetical protein
MVVAGSLPGFDRYLRRSLERRVAARLVRSNFKFLDLGTDCRLELAFNSRLGLTPFPQLDLPEWVKTLRVNVEN